MAKEQKLTDLGMAALGLLAERPMHPYEMYQLLLHRHDDLLVKVRPGTLYHAVGRLAVAKLVTVQGTEKDGNRPERTTYAITAAGKVAMETRLMEMLATPADEYPSFPQAIAEAHNLPADVVLELLGQRTQRIREQIAVYEAYANGAQARDVEKFFWIHVPYQLAMLQTEVDWIDHLCDDIRSGAVPWPVLASYSATLTSSQQPQL